MRGGLTGANYHNLSQVQTLGQETRRLPVTRDQGNFFSFEKKSHQSCLLCCCTLREREGEGICGGVADPDRMVLTTNERRRDGDFFVTISGNKRNRQN